MIQTMFDSTHYKYKDSWLLERVRLPAAVQFHEVLYL